MKTAIYPGSFDPVTLGHYDIIERSSKIFDKLIVGVLNNSAKSPLFSVEERVNMLKDVTSHFPNVEVQSFAGLLIDFVRSNDANVIVRGLRAITDFEYELQLAQMNRVIAPEIDTLFLTTNLKYAYLRLVVRNSVSISGAMTLFICASCSSYSKSVIARSPLTITFASLLRTKSIRRPAKDCTSTLGKWEVTSFNILTRSSTENNGDFALLFKTPTISLSKIFEERSMIS